MTCDLQDYGGFSRIDAGSRPKYTLVHVDEHVELPKIPEQTQSQTDTEAVAQSLPLTQTDTVEDKVTVSMSRNDDVLPPIPVAKGAFHPAASPWKTSVSPSPSISTDTVVGGVSEPDEAVGLISLNPEDFSGMVMM